MRSILTKIVHDKRILLLIPLILSAYTHLWNPIGFPSIYVDEAHYMRRALQVLDGIGPQEMEGSVNQAREYDHPYFGQIFLALMLKIIGFPNSGGLPDISLHSIEMLHFTPRILMGLLAIIDTFLVYKIAERRYDTRVAVIASILFAVMPMTWLLRRILLDSILLPFLLASILLAVYYSSPRGGLKKETYYSSILLLSGMFMGLAIFTKIPSFTAIPLIMYLIFTANNNRKLKDLAIWFIPVILIPAIWPVYAAIYGQYEEWMDGLTWQTHRVTRALFEPQESVFEIDPVLVGLGTMGIIYASIRRDLFFIMWLVSYIALLAVLGYSQYIHLVTLFPIFCLASGKLIESISNRIRRLGESYLVVPRRFDYESRRITDFFENGKPQQLETYSTNREGRNHKFITKFIFSNSSFLMLLAIATFGLVNTTILISTDVNSSFFKGYVGLIRQISDVASSEDEDESEVTVIGPRRWGIYYYWIPKYVFGKNFEFFDYKDIVTPETRNVIAIQEGRSENLDQDLAFAPKLFGTVENMARHYNYQIYPYANMRFNEIPSIQLRSNY